jgi:hypothetical protein
VRKLAGIAVKRMLFEVCFSIGQIPGLTFMCSTAYVSYNNSPAVSMGISGTKRKHSQEEGSRSPKWKHVEDTSCRHDKRKCSQEGGSRTPKH